MEWKGRDIWLKFGAVNDAYELFVNGESMSFFGEANISQASRPTFTKIDEELKYGETNHIAIQVNDWGNSGGLWRLPVILTTDEDKGNEVEWNKILNWGVNGIQTNNPGALIKFLSKREKKIYRN